MSRLELSFWIFALGALIAAMFYLTGTAHADGYGRGKKTRYYAPPVERICKDKVRGLGTQWVGTEGAMDAAKKDWMERVRYDLGESYLDLSNAEDFVSRCGRVSIGQVAGQVTYRCEVIARPCKGTFAKQEGMK